MRLTQAVMTACFVMAAGCVGGVSDLPPDDPTPDAPPATTSTAKSLYTGTVHAAVTLRCSGGACHTQAGTTGMYGFAVADASAAYEQLVVVPTLVGTFTPATAQYLSKIDTNPAGGHKGIVLSASDKTAITAWLAQEVTDRAGDPQQPPPIDPIAKLREWTGCMKLTDFNTAEMAQAWGTLAADNLQKCANCHAGGLDAFVTGNGDPGANAEVFYNAITKQKEFLLKYFTVDQTGAVIINDAAFRSAGVAIEDHPRFNPTTNAGMAALIEFYDLAKAHQVALTCDPPRLP